MLKSITKLVSVKIINDSTYKFVKKNSEKIELSLIVRYQLLPYLFI